MKKIYLVFALILLTWNIVLTLTVIDLNKKDNTEVKTTIKQLSTEFETNYTKVIETCKERVLSLSSTLNRENKISNVVVYGKNEEGDILVITQYSNVLGDNNYLLFANNEKVKAELVGYDIVSDLCILKSHPDFNVHSFVLGNSDAVNVGEYALVVSSNVNNDNFGYYSNCLISGKDRYLRIDTNRDNKYDYDLPLLQISSDLGKKMNGSALINMNGELIGLINTSIFTEDNESVALSINEIKIIVNRILSNSLKRTIQDVFVKDINDVPLYLKSYYSIPFDIEEGMVVISVNNRNSDYQVGDVIIKIDNQSIRNNNDYRNWIFNNENENYVVDIIRKGERITISK